jgi:protein-disulfide isomerase
MDTRRTVLKDMGLAALTVGATASDIEPAYALSTERTDRLQPGPLGDIWLGSPTAKVTIIEYASLTCPHCAAFHRDTWPVLKERYVDTGKVRFTIREFPLDLIATAAFMMARCDGGARYYQVIDLLLDQQPAWAFVRKRNFPVEAMAQTLHQIGFTKEKFNLCLRDGDKYTGINATKNRAGTCSSSSRHQHFLLMVIVILKL